MKITSENEEVKMVIPYLSHFDSIYPEFQCRLEQRALSHRLIGFWKLSAQDHCRSTIYRSGSNDHRIRSRHGKVSTGRYSSQSRMNPYLKAGCPLV
ncbi:unnamed protein product [Periconia digitata]|uniref:Uncharacterized protein n=1 Tax=Periconia digitata TaxID=1303443 RepID=A0A9W4UPQ4_9PLEO|nr:unnamed protein product [Periconia digitata]